MIRTLDRLTPALSRGVTLCAVMVLVAMLPWISGRDPARSILRARMGEQDASPEALAALRDRLGLAEGPVAHMRGWFAGLAQGDWGTSWISGAPVLPGMVKALGVSLTLMSAAFAVALVTAVLLAGPTMRRGLRGRDTRSSGTVAASLTAMPEFMLSALFLVVFSVWLGWLPPYGWQGPAHVVLPALALGLPGGGLLGRLLTNAVAATFHERWIATWAVAGFSRRQIARAVLRRSLPALMPQMGMIVVGMTGGAIAVEQVFSIPGLGRAVLGAASAQDLPALQAGILILLLNALVIGVVANLIRVALLGRALHMGALPVARVVPLPPDPRLWLVPAAVVVILLVLLAAGLPRDPFTSQFLRLQPPGFDLPLGADGLGRDVLARIAHGALSTVGMAVLVTLISLFIGLGMGLMPRLAIGLIEVTKATPPTIAALIVVAAMGPSAPGALLAVTAVAWAPLAAHTAALVTEARAQPHVRIAPILGVGPLRLIPRSILPAIFGPVLRHAMLRLPGNALALAALGFLGLGARPPSPEWGLILADALPYVERAPLAVLTSVLALALISVLGVSLVSMTRR
ncbi:ABC transporter permease subunit [Falsirhodobacter sp. 20TX0035]|uniref:ABC transporter permease subunit n=1 Tax=Falsirhodobacter sp. 20TX0035 TaxID=3022019 RepID=UPI002330AD75|nr:ABC transporter permease subunit [Falsirhodobacter sp. 20TX0035]MDB6452605.1 ABC transporter permease subunit [Falsirhodobacter sp. 20TX0035]